MQQQEEEVTFKGLFVPFTTKKAIVWIVIIGIVVYFNSLFNGFVWDDKTFIQLNPDMQHLNISYLFGANMFNNVGAGQYRALTAFYFTLLHTIFNDNTFFYHLMELFMHLANTILVFLLFKKFFKSYIPFFLSLIFLVHPIQVESVSYIASSDNPLFFLFGLSALLISMSQKSGLKRIILTFSFLLLSLISKETGLLFIVLVILSRFLFFKTQKFLYILGGLITLLAYFFLRFYVANVYFSKVLLAPIARLPLFTRLLSLPAIIFYYLKTFVWPIQLNIIQYWTVTNVDFSHFFIPLLVDFLFVGLAISVGFYQLKKKQKAFYSYVFFSVWLVLGFGLYSQIFALNMTVADRWFYFHLVGILGILGFGLEIFEGVVHGKHKLLWVLGVCIICVLAMRTIIRNSNWQDAITLYTHDIAIEDNFELENSLGAELNNANHPREALIHFQKSVALFPHETNLFNLGLMYERKRDLKNAEEYYEKAYKINNYGEVYFPYRRLEVIYVRYAVVVLQYDPQKALEITNEGIKDYPNDAKIWFARAKCEYKLKNHDEAVKAAKKAYELLPNNDSTLNLYNRLLNNETIDTSLQ